MINMNACQSQIWFNVACGGNDKLTFKTSCLVSEATYLLLNSQYVIVHVFTNYTHFTALCNKGQWFFLYSLWAMVSHCPWNPTSWQKKKQRFLTCSRKSPGSKFEEDTYDPQWGFSWFSSVSTRQLRNNSLNQAKNDLFNFVFKFMTRCRPVSGCEVCLSQ